MQGGSRMTATERALHEPQSNFVRSATTSMDNLSLYETDASFDDSIFQDLTMCCLQPTPGSQPCDTCIHMPLDTPSKSSSPAIRQALLESRRNQASAKVRRRACSTERKEQNRMR